MLSALWRALLNRLIYLHWFAQDMAEMVVQYSLRTINNQFQEFLEGIIWFLRRLPS